MLNGKGIVVILIAGLIKKDVIQMSEYFPKLKALGANVKVELDLSNYGTDTNLENTTWLHQNLLK